MKEIKYWNNECAVLICFYCYPIVHCSIWTLFHDKFDGLFIKKFLIAVQIQSMDLINYSEHAAVFWAITIRERGLNFDNQAMEEQQLEVSTKLSESFKILDILRYWIDLNPRPQKMLFFPHVHCADRSPHNKACV